MRDTRLLILPFLALACPVAGASTLFEQLPGIDSGSLTISSTLNNLGGSPGFRVAGSFLLPAGGTVTEVEWWGRLRSGGASFEIAFYSNQSGRPGTPLSTVAVTPTSSSAITGSPFDPVTFYSAALDAPFTAAPGTTYWMSVFDNAPDARWLWLTANIDTVGAARQQNGSTAWSATDNVAFRLAAEVPEPSTFAFVLLAMFCFLHLAHLRR